MACSRPNQDRQIAEPDFRFRNWPTFCSLSVGISAVLASLALKSLQCPHRYIAVRTANDLSRYFRDEVVRTAEVQYDLGRSDSP